ncbi:hypothetical protein K2173_027956 [Erythroxylum novogranatense]|uniref:Protein kinase domain-containing protein n=1 Tax=Erythroxylum novogranatense TaxID=1862640 RepID=A0AAV8U3H2_9ROSI|nr:hypothetical protein K2173_027956 [Erythroxylum novogranatense]
MRSEVGSGVAMMVKKSIPDSDQGLWKWQDYNAKLSDFGLANLCPENGNSHVTSQPKSTYDYAAPEYVGTGKFLIFTIA